MAKSEVICDNCSHLFMKENKEINRANKLNKKHYCSRTCALDVNRRFHEASCVFHNAKKRSDKKNIEFNLTKEFISDLYILQNGKCAISGIDIFFTKAADDKILRQVSIDRIDNSKGYTIDNVHLVALGINYMRNTASLEETKEFMELLQK